ncbi:putative tRNA methyltransferase [Aspergillus clavatus NRRL 1]|uniref:tRNA (guanine-N(7)-)-methyltransferase non-catalytic subunit trm82 n=1 Tax=Aspergillus clavatus (strain ATCC 1007 / CBS 513.65 / DSM 816 / NCTC 3887 / NRRL 1 / QM 1276 / 107) TaxID=344612 RepID=TRM82_ASPCL|nr:tRNA methyltransferase, putative [Aspergillus clavatus NRRL 1]A1CRF7.1 RecName: Full=tRNA (guanine-N(7)-)-methyltransferase non-catalytic subunit trm82; AltName: Full=Transfer RNA methyltransferase 82 [Aspergillus clavatus NRRL 1]EAW08228.1 tRNA methyltransferase, putative [Aspergillus clavatus NRRL 1]
MAATFQYPFQCIKSVERRNSGRQLIIGSAGPKIYTYAAETGERLGIWPETANTAEAKAAPSTTGEEPPEKRRKVSPPPDQKPEDSEPASQKSRKPEASPAWSTIPILAVSADGEYVVAVTAEDKCIRVFEVEENGALKQLSERQMPKRPSAIALADDDRTILCGDKFGDVYSLPLIDTGKGSVAPRAPAKVRPDQPAATTLTVHSKRNLASLEQQLRHYGQKDKNSAEEKPSSTFEHHLLLGHVSMLTDLICVSIPMDSSSEKKRSYILTADRDEHIRVSRGPSQAHIIENYCLGHTSFVNSLCIPQWAPEYLVSGGGDNYLLVWRWNEGRIVQKVPLVDETSDSEVAVRGIWVTDKMVLVAIDGSAKLLCFTLESDGTMKAQNSIQASGNVLDLTISSKDSAVLVSVDAVHVAGSTQEWRATPSSSSTLIEAFRLKSDTENVEWEPMSEAITSQVNSQGTSEISATLEEKQKKELNDALYSSGNLRKKNLGEDE